MMTYSNDTYIVLSVKLLQWETTYSILADNTKTTQNCGTRQNVQNHL